MLRAARPTQLAVLALAAAFSFSVSADAVALSPSLIAPAEDQAVDGTALPDAVEGTVLPHPGRAQEPGAGNEQALEAPPATDDSDASTDSAPGTGAGEPSGEAAPADSQASDTPTAEIIRDLSTLPQPVRQMRERLVEAAASGDIERLRPLIEGTPKPPQIMNGESTDPVETLKSFSGDPDGQEILAIMLDILSTGVARVEAGTPDETYVWPYFAGKPLDTLTPPERVELLRIVTAGDLLGMEENNNYNFYRIGITPDGQWRFMTGGD